MSVLDKHAAAYADRNPFLLALLGAVRVAARFERLAERTARPWHGAEGTDSDALYAVLGVVHLAQRIVMTGALVPAPPADGTSVSVPRPPPDSLLR